jgi:hypothetical protein
MFGPAASAEPIKRLQARTEFLYPTTSIAGAGVLGVVYWNVR